MLDELLLIKCVLVVNYHAPSAKSNFDLAIALRNRLFTTFKNNPTVLPEELPPEVPRVVFSQENGFALATLENKSELSFTNENKISSSDSLNSFLGVAISLIETVIQDFECSISKIGFVVNGHLNVGIDGTRYVANQYLKEGNFHEAIGAEAHWLYNPEIEGQKINRWVRIQAKSGDQSIPPNSIGVFIDTNTILKDDYSISEVQAGQFLTAFISDLTANLPAIVRS